MNEIEKAIQAVKDFDSHKIGQYGLAEHLNTVISALEQQIPKKPKEGSRAKIAGIEGANCGTCGGVIFAPKNYCYKCGQAIDWSVEE